jgi:hypothetical protein
MKPELIIIAVNILIFVVAPFLPNVFYENVLNNYFAAAVLFGLNLYSILYGYLAAVSTFMGVTSLYAEMHARKAKKIKQVKEQTLKGEVLTQFEKPEPIIPNEIHPEPHTPEGEEVAFVPKKDSGDDVFEPVDKTINEKEALPTISLSKDAEQLYEDKNLADKIE